MERPITIISMFPLSSVDNIYFRMMVMGAKVGAFRKKNIKDICIIIGTYLFVRLLLTAYHNVVYIGESGGVQPP